jgi:hypothetical protein
VKKIVENILSTGIVLIVFFIIFDSGGQKNLRLIALSVVLLVGAIVSIRGGWRQDQVILYFSSICFIMFSSIRSVVAGIEVIDIIPWIIPLMMFPAFLAFCEVADVKQQHFMFAGAIFGMIVILIFIGRLSGNSILMEVNELLTSGAPGFFNYKKSFFQNELPVVYFQGTLSLVFIGVLAWGYGKYMLFTVVLLALIVAPSRFGVAVLCAFSIMYTLLKFSKFKYDLFLGKLVIGTIVILVVHLLIHINSYSEVFYLSLDHVRMGHVESVFSLLNDDLSIVFIGSGPGTQFYTTGFGRLTDNIEISQLGLIRKFGVFLFVLLHLYFVKIIIDLIKVNRNVEVFSLLAHYIVSISNPVLFSIPFLIFLSFCVNLTRKGSIVVVR